MDFFKSRKNRMAIYGLVLAVGMHCLHWDEGTVTRIIEFIEKYIPIVVPILIGGNALEDAAQKYKFGFAAPLTPTTAEMDKR